MRIDRLWTRTTPVPRAFVLVLLAWLVGEAVETYPFYLAYFNELVGGPANGYKYLTDSNLDWGQDLKGLGAYLRQNNIASVKLAYSGADDPRMYGIAYEPLLPGQPVTGYVAVSVNVLTGTLRWPACARAFEWLQRYEPIAKIGYSIFVYHVFPTRSPPPAVSLPECKLQDDLLQRFLRP